MITDRSGLIDNAHMTRDEVEQLVQERIFRVMPKNARSSFLTAEGHPHNAAHMKGGGGIVHYDYVVDASYTGAAGATVTLTGGSSAKMYATIQAAITAADADNAARSIKINAGTYTENITVASTFAHTLHIFGEGSERTVIDGTFTYSPTATTLYLEHLTINSTFTGNTVADSANTIRAYSVRFLGAFDGNVGVSGINAWFTHCHFASTLGGTRSISADFENCYMGSSSGIAFSGGGLSGCHFTNCTIFKVDITGTASIQNVFFGTCTFSGTTSKSFHINSTGVISFVIFDNCKYSTPSTSTLFSIHVEACAATSESVIVSDSKFQYSTISPLTTRRWIQCDTANLTGWAIVGNRFGRQTSGNYLEDDGAVSVQGVFVDSVIGPNSPPDFKLQADAGSSGSQYYGSSTVSGAGVSGVTTVAFDESLYAKLAGRSGGQTLIGSTATGLGLTFRANSADTNANNVRVLPSADAGTSTATSATTLTDSTKAWVVGEWVGATVSSGGKTMVITSNTATVLTGAAWVAAGAPALGAYTIAGMGVTYINPATAVASSFMLKGVIGTEANPRWSLGFDASSLVELGLGPGGATAMDVFLRRRTTRTLTFVSSSTTLPPTLGARDSNDTADTWTLDTFNPGSGRKGRFLLGGDGTTAPDAGFRRGEDAGIIRTQNILMFPNILIQPTPPLTVGPGYETESPGYVYFRSPGGVSGGDGRLFYLCESGSSLLEIGPLGLLRGTVRRFFLQTGWMNVFDGNGATGTTGISCMGILGTPDATSASSADAAYSPALSLTNAIGSTDNTFEISGGLPNKGDVIVIGTEKIQVVQTLNSPDRVRGYRGAYGSAAAAHGAGAAVSLAGGATKTLVGADGEPCLEQDTSTTSGTDAALSYPSDTKFICDYHCEPLLVYKFDLRNITDVRLFIGFTDQTRATMLASDDPAGNYWGLSFSTGRGDTRFQCVTKNGIPNSTITANTAANPTVITTSAAHGLTAGTKIRISGSNSTPSIDGDWEVISTPSTTTFTIGYRILSNSVANPTVVTIVSSLLSAHALDATNTVTISGSDSTPTIDGNRTISSPTALTFTVPVNVTGAGSTGTIEMNCTGAGSAGTVTTQNLQDTDWTGHPAVASKYYVVLEKNGGADPTISLFDSTWVQIGTTETLSANQPTADASALRIVAGIRNTAAASKRIRHQLAMLSISPSVA